MTHVTCHRRVTWETIVETGIFQVRTGRGPKNLRSADAWSRGCLVDEIHSCKSLNCLSSSSEDFFTFRPIFLFSFQIIKIFVERTMDCGPGCGLGCGPDCGPDCGPNYGLRCGIHSGLVPDRDEKII